MVDFIQQGAEDPAVVSMKQTLYRTSHDSPMFQALIEAAATKEATLVVELMARFDEASNIRWARSMEDAGVQVFHGVVGLKTHCKLAMLVRRDEDGVTRRYCHLGTGNYNPVTARFYTDLSLLTCDPQITERVHMVFNYLTAHAEIDDYRPLLVAPLTMAESFLGLIRREQEHAQAGRPAHIVAKMNALLEPSVIEALYPASQAGVEIDLIVRGLCILRPGVKGLSERIRVRSIVGRFLEHSRIFHFANGGNDEIYLGSADWMPRNLFERCEVVFPVRDPAAQARIHDEILPAYLADTAQGPPAAARRQLPPRRQAAQGRQTLRQPIFQPGLSDAIGRGQSGAERHPQTQRSCRCEPAKALNRKSGSPALESRDDQHLVRRFNLRSRNVELHLQRLQFRLGAARAFKAELILIMEATVQVGKIRPEGYRIARSHPETPAAGRVRHVTQGTLAAKTPEFSQASLIGPVDRVDDQPRAGRIVDCGHYIGGVWIDLRLVITQAVGDHHHLAPRVGAVRGPVPRKVGETEIRAGVGALRG